MCRVVLHRARSIVKALQVICIKSDSLCVCAGLKALYLHYWEQCGRTYPGKCYVSRELAKDVTDRPGCEKIVELVSV